MLRTLLGLTLLVCTWRWPVPGRCLYARLFVAASVVNATLAVRDPAVYLTYSSGATDAYRDIIIDGPFRQHPAAFVRLIALGQFAVGLCLVLGGRWLDVGLVGGVLFLLAIAPLGVTGSAFPATLVMAGGLLLLGWRAIAQPDSA